MVLKQMPLSTIKMIYMVPNSISSSTIGHHRNDLYGTQWSFVEVLLGTIEMIYMHGAQKCFLSHQ